MNSSDLIVINDEMEDEVTVTNASNEVNIKEEKLGIYNGKAVIYGL